MTVAEYNKSVEDYSDRVFSFILKNLKDKDTASDIVQEAYTRLWLKVGDVSFNKVRSYLFTAAYHIMIDNIRKNKRLEGFDHTNYDNYSHTEQYSDVKEVIDNALDQLPDMQRSVILLRDYEGYSYHEISEITGLSESQVKVYIYRGRLALKKVIGSPEAVI